MVRAAQQKVYADFRQGFVTVANPLAYPEGSLKDIVNFDIQDNGTLRIRPGLRQETALTVATPYTVAEINNKALSVHVWDNVNNSGEEKIAVVQVGTYLYLFPMLEQGIDIDSPVGSPMNIGLPSTGESTNISTATGNGRLFVAHPSIRSFSLSKPLDTVIKEDITIKIRDLDIWKGLNDNETGFNQTTLYPQHEYNLRNGGWPDSATVSKEPNPDNGITTSDPVRYMRTKVGRYPKISMPFYVGRAGGGGGINEQTAFNPWQLQNDYFGNSIIPRGKFIVNAENWSRTGTGNTKLTGDSTSNNLTKTYSWTSYPSSIEFYSGRVWYTGARGYKEQSSLASYEKKDNLDVSNTIYFSQQLGTDFDKVGFCYQENDPTAEDINQLLATDGGTLAIRGAGDILDIKVFGTSLIIFSKQGVWAISGADTNSFKADSFSVNKISNIGPISGETILANSSNIYYIATDAIYELTVDEVTGNPTPRDITSARIKDFYNKIPLKQKERAKAFFDTSNRNLYVFYSDVETPSDTTNNLEYNKCLVFNQDLGCFYKYEFNSDTHYVVDGLFYNKDQQTTLTTFITSDGNPVVSDGNPVVLEEEYSTSSLNNIQLLTVVDNAGNAEIVFSSFTDTTNLEDWGGEYRGYAIPGFDTAGDIMRDSLKTPVIITHMERTEDGFEINPEDPEGTELILTNGSSCFMSYGWDWATEYKNSQQIYRFNRNYTPYGVSDPFDYGVDVITTRNRIQGKGNSLGIRLDSEAGKDCRILGIGILYTQAQRI